MVIRWLAEPSGYVIQNNPKRYLLGEKTGHFHPRGVLYKGGDGGQLQSVTFGTRKLKICRLSVVLKLQGKRLFPIALCLSTFISARGHEDPLIWFINPSFQVLIDSPHRKGFPCLHTWYRREILHSYQIKQFDWPIFEGLNYFKSQQIRGFAGLGRHEGSLTGKKLTERWSYIGCVKFRVHTRCSNKAFVSQTWRRLWDCGHGEFDTCVRSKLVSCATCFK